MSPDSPITHVELDNLLVSDDDTPTKFGHFNEFPRKKGEKKG